MEGLGKDGKKDCGWFLCKKGPSETNRRFKPNPKKKVHDYCCASCRIAAWNFRTAGVEAISKMQVMLAEHGKRLEKLEGKNEKD
jgi:hypothetical protein